MSNLDNLTAKILADANRRADQLIAEAEAAAQSVLHEQAAQTGKECAHILAEAQAESAQLAEQIMLAKTLLVRDENLAAKQTLLDSIFADALAELNAMPGEQFLAFLAHYLKDADLEGQQLILPAKYGITDIAALTDLLNAAGCKGVPTLVPDDRSIRSGFVLRKDGIELNNTFEALVSYHRYELESAVLNMLC